MSDDFTLKPGRWMLTYSNGDSSIVESDGTKVITLGKDGLTWVIAIPANPALPQKSQPVSGETSSSPSPSETLGHPI